MVRIPTKSEDGYVMVTALIALAVMAILAVAALTQANTSLRMARQGVRAEQALYAANAGVEMILGRMQVVDPVERIVPGQTYTGSFSLPQGLTATYAVLVTDPKPAAIHVKSTGQVTDGTETHSRVVEADIPFNRDEGGGGNPNPTPPPSGLGEDLLFSNGALTLSNNSNICGSLYVNGDLELGNWTKVWGTTTGSPCKEIIGTGIVIATGKMNLKQNVDLPASRLCASNHYGPGTACPSGPPTLRSLPKPDFAQLRQDASRWYVPNATFCKDKPAGSCQVVGKKDTVTIRGAQSFQGEIIYIDGNLTNKGGLTITGTVTFAVTGDVSLDSDLLCTGTCTVAIIADGNIDLKPNTTQHATFYANGRLTGNQNTIHGRLFAGSMDLKNGLTLYPPRSSIWSPGLPGGPQAPGGGTGTGPRAPASYSDWKQ